MSGFDSDKHNPVSGAGGETIPFPVDLEPPVSRNQSSSMIDMGVLKARAHALFAMQNTLTAITVYDDTPPEVSAAIGILKDKLLLHKFEDKAGHTKEALKSKEQLCGLATGFRKEKSRQAIKNGCEVLGLFCNNGVTRSYIHIVSKELYKLQRTQEQKSSSPMHSWARHAQENLRKKFHEIDKKTATAVTTATVAVITLTSILGVKAENALHMNSNALGTKQAQPVVFDLYGALTTKDALTLTPNQQTRYGNLKAGLNTDQYAVESYGQYQMAVQTLREMNLQDDPANPDSQEDKKFLTLLFVSALREKNVKLLEELFSNTAITPNTPLTIGLGITMPLDRMLMRGIRMSDDGVPISPDLLIPRWNPGDITKLKQTLKSDGNGFELQR